MANKIDREGRVIDRDDVLKYAQEIRAVCFETSAQENIGKKKKKITEEKI